MILANDERPRTMHAKAARTDRILLPGIVAALLNRNDERRTTWREARRQHTAQPREREAALEWITATSPDTTERSRSVDRGYGVEL